MRIERGPIGYRIHYFSEIGSTNDEAARLAELGAPEGTIVIASAQTAGRGRFGRTWFSPPGAGIYVSVICRDARAVPYLSLAAGVAVADAIRTSTGLPVEIKWPNDIVVRGGRGRRRKLAGILAEASTSPEGVQHVVVGVGINLRPAAYPPEIADLATSLESELGREVAPATVLATTLVGFTIGSPSSGRAIRRRCSPAGVNSLPRRRAQRSIGQRGRRPLRQDGRNRRRRRAARQRERYDRSHNRGNGEMELDRVREPRSAVRRASCGFEFRSSHGLGPTGLDRLDD